MASFGLTSWDCYGDAKRRGETVDKSKCSQELIKQQMRVSVANFHTHEIILNYLHLKARF